MTQVSEQGWVEGLCWVADFLKCTSNSRMMICAKIKCIYRHLRNKQSWVCKRSIVDWKLMKKHYEKSVEGQEKKSSVTVKTQLSNWHLHLIISCLMCHRVKGNIRKGVSLGGLGWIRVIWSQHFVQTFGHYIQWTFLGILHKTWYNQPGFHV